MKRLAAVLVLGALVPGTATAAVPVRGSTSVDQTIRGGPRTGAFSFLGLGPGEPYVVRADLAPAGERRASRRRSLSYFAQLTDFQLADEESPARVEATDVLGSIFIAAWRPQEALMPFVVDQAVRQVNAHRRSPVRGAGGRRARMGFAITTGDSTDNAQFNETAWVVRLLEGGRVHPNSGSPRRADRARCPGGTPSAAEARRYTGVQDSDDYAGPHLFYDPDRPEGEYAGWPRYPGLMDRAQRPFRAAGLDVPSYVTFGNHDGLVQGNFPASTAHEQVAVGCLKLLGPAHTGSDLGIALDPAKLAALRATDPGRVALVPPDPRRRFVSKAEYERVHLRGGQPDGHGFGLVDPRERRASRGAAGYYAFTPARGMRFIGLETMADAGISGGNIDDPQFRWLERELRRATRRNEIVVVFGHHAIQSLTEANPDEKGPECTRPDSHGHDVNPGCDADPRDSSPIHLGDDVRDLLLAHPHVIAFVAGHSHVNDVTSFPRADGSGFWMIRTAAEADWPVQQRLLEVMDNRDGTLSVFGTVIDVAAPVVPPRAGTGAGTFAPAQLASVARVLAYNDPQDGGGTGEGQADDRNVELLVRDPRR